MLLQEPLVPVPATPAGRRPGRIAVAGWVLLVTVAVVIGTALPGEEVALRAAPFTGAWDWRPAPGLAVAVVVGGVVVAAGPTMAERAWWRPVAMGAGGAAVAMLLAVNTAHGWDRLTAPLVNRHEYEPFAASISSAGAFVDGFVSSIPDLPIHVRAHPPLATLVPWGLDTIGLHGAGWWAALVILGWGTAVTAALVTLRSVTGEVAARRAAPGMVLLPAVVWAGTSADALFAGVVAVGIALVVCRPGGHIGAFGGGAVLGAALLLSYGLALAWVIPGAAAWHRRRIDGLVAAAVGAAVVLGWAATAGFWWLDGLTAARQAYWDGVAAERPLPYLALLGNPAVLAVALGPAVVAGLCRGHNPLSLGALVAVGAANASLLSAGEVERIWLPFVPWLGLASRGERPWLAAQLAVTLAVALTLPDPLVNGEPGTVAVAVIGGSGLYELAPVVAEVGGVRCCDLGGVTVAFLNRHGDGHRLPPHAVDYRGNLRALTQLGVGTVLASFACGSLVAELGPGSLVVPDQLIDRTRGRVDTFHDRFEDGPAHAPFADPYDAGARRLLLDAAPEAVDGATVVVIDGPRFATRAESAWYRSAGASLINMTQYPEAVLARELGIAYAGVGLVTDHDAGVPGREDIAPVTQEAVFAAFARHLPRLREVLSAAAVAAASSARQCP